MVHPTRVMSLADVHLLLLLPAAHSPKLKIESFSDSFSKKANISSQENSVFYDSHFFLFTQNMRLHWKQIRNKAIDLRIATIAPTDRLAFLQLRTVLHFSMK